MNQIVVSQLDSAGYFAGAVLADESPLEAGVYLIPFGAVAKAPPEISTSQRAQLVQGEWVVFDVPEVQSLEPDAEPTFDELKDQLKEAVQKHLDDGAKAFGYDNISTAVTYAGEPAVPKFQREGRALRAWRSLVWAYCYAMLDNVVAGERAIPSSEELMVELPVLLLVV